MFSTPEEDEMGSPQPSAAEQYAKQMIRELEVMRPVAEEDTDTVFARFLTRHLDAYAAAALTDEQRDVLTVWEWLKAVTGPGDRLDLVKTGAMGIEEARVRHTDIAMLAQRIREQGAK